jgi:hypothetical protein
MMDEGPGDEEVDEGPERSPAGRDAEDEEGHTDGVGDEGEGEAGQGTDVERVGEVGRHGVEVLDLLEAVPEEERGGDSETEGEQAKVESGVGGAQEATGHENRVHGELGLRLRVW